MAAAQQSPQQLAASNFSARQALLASAPRLRKRIINTVLNPVPAEYRLKLNNLGILTSLDIHLLYTINVTVVATAGGRAPWVALQYLKLLDFDQTQRINVSGYQAWLWQSIRQLAPAHSVTQIASTYAGTPAGWIYTTFPFTGLAVSATQSVQFMLHVDVAYDERSDLRGAMLMQTDTGEAYLVLDFPATLVGTDVESLYNSGTAAYVSVQVIVYQNYLNPLAVNGAVPLPMADLSTVYELAGTFRSNANLAANAEALIAYPNARTVLGFYLEYVNAGLFTAGTDVSNIRTIANGNTTVEEFQPIDLVDRVRRALKDDLPGDNYYLSHRQRPVETAQYGNFQIGFTPLTVNAGNTYLEWLFEDMYPKGSLLQGFRQIGG